MIRLVQLLHDGIPARVLSLWYYYSSTLVGIILSQSRIMSRVCRCSTHARCKICCALRRVLVLLCLYYYTVPCTAAGEHRSTEYCSTVVEHSCWLLMTETRVLLYVYLVEVHSRFYSRPSYSAVYSTVLQYSRVHRLKFYSLPLNGGHVLVSIHLLASWGTRQTRVYAPSGDIRPAIVCVTKETPKRFQWPLLEWPCGLMVPTCSKQINSHN